MTRALIALTVIAVAIAAIATMGMGGRRRGALAAASDPRAVLNGTAVRDTAVKNLGMKNLGIMKVLMVVLLVLAAGAVLAVGVSSAIFTSTATVGSNTFNTGTVSISTSPTSAIWSAVTVGAPGDRVTGSLTVTNGGSLPLRYAVTGSVTNSTLAAGMNLRIGLQAGGSCDFPYYNTDGTTTTLTDDTQLFGGALNTTAIIGNTNQGQQSGDRTLAASASEVLCFSAVLPLSAGNSLQGLSNTTTFTFNAEQTTNNP
jgi:spore coat-associated protein N